MLLIFFRLFFLICEVLFTFFNLRDEIFFKCIEPVFDLLPLGLVSRVLLLLFGSDGFDLFLLSLKLL